MEGLTIGLAITAVIMAVLAISFEFFFYRWQTQQGNDIRKDNSDFAKEMHEILGHIRGVTSTTQQQLQDHFATLLNAWIEQYQGNVQTRLDEGTSPAFERLANRMNEVEKLVSTSLGDEKGKVEIAQIKKEVEDIKDAQRQAIKGPLRVTTPSPFTGKPITFSPSPLFSGTLDLGKFGLGLDQPLFTFIGKGAEEDSRQDKPTKKTRKKSGKTRKAPPITLDEPGV